MVLATAGSEEGAWSFTSLPRDDEQLDARSRRIPRARLALNRPGGHGVSLTVSRMPRNSPRPRSTARQPAALHTTTRSHRRLSTGAIVARRRHRDRRSCACEPEHDRGRDDDDPSPAPPQQHRHRDCRHRQERRGPSLRDELCSLGERRAAVNDEDPTCWASLGERPCVGHVLGGDCQHPRRSDKRGCGYANQGPGPGGEVERTHEERERSQGPRYKTGR